MTDEMMDEIWVEEFESADELAEALADSVAQSLAAAVEMNGAASLVVSGGSTPKPFFKALKQHNLPWQDIYVTLADERWVKADHADSNEKLVRDLLLPEGANFVSLTTSHATPHEAEAEVNARLEEYFPEAFDVVILGMGDDGHTASLFPNAPELADALGGHVEEAAKAITPPSYAPHKRMTLTRNRLLHADRVILHFTGEKKIEVLGKAVSEATDEQMPIRALLLQDETPVEIVWAP